MSLDAQTIKTIGFFFPRSEGKRNIAERVLKLDHYPSIQEIDAIAKEFGLGSTSGWEAVNKLKEGGLITEAEGSIPLYRSRLRSEIKGELPQFPNEVSSVPPMEEGVQKGADGDIRVHNRVQNRDPFHEQPRVENPKPEDQSENPERQRPSIRTVRELDVGLSRVESSTQKIEVQLNSVLRELEFVVNGLKGQGSAPRQEDHDPPPQEEGGSARRPLVEDADEVNIKLLSREELEAVALGQRIPTPSARSPQLNDSEQSASDETLRKIIIQVTSYSMIAFDKARQGGFSGTFSDFVNTSIESVFKDRGYALVWTKIDPISHRLIPPQVSGRNLG